MSVLALLSISLPMSAGAASVPLDAGAIDADRLGTDALGLWDPAAAIAPAVTTVDPASTIVGLEVDRAAFSPNEDGIADTIRIGFGSTVAQHVRVAVVDSAGSLVHVIVDTDLVTGPAAFEWDGTDDAGAPVADGAYELVVDAGAAASIEHVSKGVVVDRAAPKLAALPARVALTSRFARSFQLPVTLSEPALLDVATRGRAGYGRATSSETAGTVQLTLPVRNRPQLRRILAKRRVPVRANILATDAAGNRSVRHVTISLGQEENRGGADNATRAAQLAWPVSAPLTSRFGMRWGRLHAGVDFGAHIGQPIAAAAAGRVTEAGWMSGYGNAVLVDHGGGLATLYAHQSRIVTHVGATVQRGELIGYTGNTGNSTGPHLHFEVHVDGVARDPMGFLP